MSEQQQPIPFSLNGKLKAEVPNPEVVPAAKRRQFTAAYKRRILEEAEQCQDPGQIGALLRREGLYSSHLSPMAATAGSRAGTSLAVPPAGSEARTSDRRSEPAAPGKSTAA